MAAEHGEEQEAWGSGVHFAQPPPSGDCVFWAQLPPTPRSPPGVSGAPQACGTDRKSWRRRPPAGRDARRTHLAASCTHGNEATGLQWWSRSQQKQVPGSLGRQGPRGPRGPSGGRGQAHFLRAWLLQSLPGGCLHTASSRWAVGPRLRNWCHHRPTAELCTPRSPKARPHFPAP